MSRGKSRMTLITTQKGQPKPFGLSVLKTTRRPEMICGWGRMAAQGCSKRCAGAVERRLAQHERRHCVRVGSSGGRGGLAQGAAVTVEVAAPSNTTEAHPVGRPGTQPADIKSSRKLRSAGP
jgi:hypothetical protein